MSISDRIRGLDVRVLSNDWYVLRKNVFEYRRNNGEWQKQSRESYDRGNGATILLYDLARGTVILTRQFRFPAFASGWDDLMTETPAGLLDDAAPEVRIVAETEEETGYVIGDVRKVFEAFMSPGAVTEKIHFFVAAYTPADRRDAGGGLADEGEDIDVLELPFAEAYAMIGKGEIVDAKTIMLLQHAALTIFSRV
jgi:nudix-type nucleoside diphosphatase (YffH/AdpP family)